VTAVVSRRALLAAGGGLIVSFHLRASLAADAGSLPGSLKISPLLDAWIRVAPDGRITVFTGKAELGQGLKTALLQVAAEQLDVARPSGSTWLQPIRPEHRMKDSPPEATRCRTVALPS
jgi:nicotinate dehydrogenase subunit B